MRLLHISDWHLGRVTYTCPRAPDHDRVISEIMALARDFKPHLICHTGDLFDTFRPGYPDLQRGVTALQELATVSPVAVICGNHDSPALFRLFADLVGKESPIRFIDKARPPSAGGILEFPGERGEVIRLAPLPFVHANRMVEYFEDPSTWMAEYADRVHEIESTLARGLAEGYDPSRHVLIFAAHLYVSGAVLSNSERGIHISDMYASRIEHLPQVSYAAFGHIHRPQALPTSLVVGRYAGSPIPLDFGEEGEDKTAVLVEAKPGRAAEVTTHPLTGGRPLRRLAGTLDELLRTADQVGNALCLVTVRTEQPTPDLADRVREIFPEAVLLDVYEECDARRVTVLEADKLSEEAEPSFAEAFRTYLLEQGTRKAQADRVLETFDALLEAIEREEEPILPLASSLADETIQMEQQK